MTLSWRNTHCCIHAMQGAPVAAAVPATIPACVPAAAAAAKPGHVTGRQVMMAMQMLLPHGPSFCEPCYGIQLPNSSPRCHSLLTACTALLCHTQHRHAHDMAAGEHRSPP